MLKYNFILKNGIAKARMCMAASVAASTLALGFTSQAAAMQEESLPVSVSLQTETVFANSSEAVAGGKLAKIKRKPTGHAEESLAKAEEEAKVLAAQREAERQKEEEQRKAARARQVSAGGGSGGKELLASIIFCEAGNQSFEGQVAVGAVVLNRIADNAYPNTLEGVIYQPGQFGPAGSGWLDRVRSTAGYTASAMQAAEAALAGQNPVGGCLYFDQGGYGMQIGAHFFH